MSHCELAEWRGPVPNKYANPPHQKKGLVLHVMEGSATSADNWFKNPTSQASAHFGVRRDGTLWQWVDTDTETAWAEADGNPYWVSVECEGTTADGLTDAMVATLARLYAWGYRRYDWALQISDQPDVNGLGWHGMGGASWGNHPGCPGDLIKSKRPAILARARDILNGTDTGHTPPPAEEIDLIGYVYSPKGGTKLTVLVPSGRRLNFDEIQVLQKAGVKFVDVDKDVYAAALTEADGD